jgi:hypothetical protein
MVGRRGLLFGLGILIIAALTLGAEVTGTTPHSWQVAHAGPDCIFWYSELDVARTKKITFMKRCCGARAIAPGVYQGITPFCDFVDVPQPRIENGPARMKGPLRSSID